MLYADAKESNILAMMTSLHRRLAQQLRVDREHEFFTHSLQLLTTVSGQQVELKTWTITPYEVEYKRKIGYGGLYGHPILIDTRRFIYFKLADRCTKECGTGRE